MVICKSDSWARGNDTRETERGCGVDAECFIDDHAETERAFNWYKGKLDWTSSYDLLRQIPHRIEAWYIYIPGHGSVNLPS